MPNSWKQINIILNSNNNLEEIEDFFWENGALAVTNESHANEYVFELQTSKHQPIKPDFAQPKLKILFSEDTNLEPIKDSFIEHFENEINDIKLESIAEQNWQAICQQNFKAMQFGKRLWVCSSWSDVPKDANAIIKLDPGMAFGTGTHPTTSLCLKWLEANISKDKNQTVIDFGCGSGILAIAALKLGAKNAIATDCDPIALETTKENATTNDIKINNLQCFLPHEMPDIKADIVVANILANPLCELSETLRSLVKPNGKLILSGILKNQENMVIKEYKDKFKNISVDYENEWCRICLFD